MMALSTLKFLVNFPRFLFDLSVAQQVEIQYSKDSNKTSL